MARGRRLLRDLLLLVMMMAVLFTVIDFFRAPQAPGGFA